MGHIETWSFLAKPEKPKPTKQTKETPQSATRPKPEPAPQITDYASL